MKIKFSRTLAIACILCLAFATLTAFADVTVTTITNYDYEAAADADMTITTTVAGLEQDGEITYYVAKENGDIVYIDQATAEDNKAVFAFVASKENVLAASAKNGSDKGYAFPTFVFNDGCNYLTQGTATVAKTDANCGYDEATKTYTFQGKVSGATTVYGVKITVDGVEEELLAMGCDKDGTFAVEIQNITAEEAATVVGFAR